MNYLSDKNFAQVGECLERVLVGEDLSLSELVRFSTLRSSELFAAAGKIRDAGFGGTVTYSRKAFVPVTQLCRDVCHYCTFSKTPREVSELFMSEDQVLAVARAGKKAGCHEVLLTLGEKPELRYSAAAEWLQSRGFKSTVHYVAHLASRIVQETGLLPHANLGTLSEAEAGLLRESCPSVGLMLESTSLRLCEPGMPHHGSPDKHPGVRLEALRVMGKLKMPTTTGILVGIGENELERLDALVTLRAIHAEHGHIQELIVQNFCAKSGTRMAQHPSASSEDLQRTIALARLAFGATMSIQAPPNLSPTECKNLIAAGINDWGGVSPLTPDYVNPEAPWPPIARLERQTEDAGKTLVPRLTVYPHYVKEMDTWIAEKLKPAVRRLQDSEGFARDCDWTAGAQAPLPSKEVRLLSTPIGNLRPTSEPILAILERIHAGREPSEAEIETLFSARGDDFALVCSVADVLRKKAVGDQVSYVVTRNINYTNVCTYGCKFCAFSKGKTSETLRGAAYDLPLEEVARRTEEAWARGATEVCMQGGIHPSYTGETYLEICRTVKRARPEMHIHAFSPLEVSQGAATLGISVGEFLRKLQHEGLGSLPGTAAEVLHDEVRKMICPDKLTTAEWLDVIETAHKAGIKTTATIMFGHVDRAVHWARHLVAIRDLQKRTGGFTEFVPLPFVAQETPIFRKGLSRNGPTFREAVLMHAIARIALFPHIKNIQASWVKLGSDGAKLCLSTGVNDLGGTLMNESITRAAGAKHGQEASPAMLESWISSAGRVPRQRTTKYGDASAGRREVSYGAAPLLQIVSMPLKPRATRQQSASAED